MNWKYAHISTIEEMILTGWKIYVYGKTLDHSKVVERLIDKVIKEYNTTAKFATKGIIERNLNIKPAWGVAVIYLHTDLFKRNLIPVFLKRLYTSLITYDVYGHYKGSDPLTSNISIRYDISIPVNPNIGIGYNEYLEYYRGEFGYFNIPNNPVPKQLLTKLV